MGDPLRWDAGYSQMSLYGKGQRYTAHTIDTEDWCVPGHHHYWFNFRDDSWTYAYKSKKSAVT
jgi:hypothetical protein